MDVVKNTPISFEFFPPKTSAGIMQLTSKANLLQNYQPEYFSVTFGAAGAVQLSTVNVVRTLVKNNLSIAPHITCIGLSKENIFQLLRTYQEIGINRLVVLRGDFSEEITSPGEFNFANQLVEFIRAETGNHFIIEVAAYPEFHPQALSITDDLSAFKRKVEAGADRAITQYFYNVEGYFHFIENCKKLNIHIPIIPGIMPIRNFQQLLRFSKLCGADLPLWLSKRLEEYRHDEQAFQQFGCEVVVRLCEALLKFGVPGLHFYTLNELEPTMSILTKLNLRPVVNQNQTSTPQMA